MPHWPLYRKVSPRSLAKTLPFTLAVTTISPESLSGAAETIRAGTPASTTPYSVAPPARPKFGPAIVTVSPPSMGTLLGKTAPRVATSLIVKPRGTTVRPYFRECTTTVFSPGPPASAADGAVRMTRREDLALNFLMTALPIRTLTRSVQPSPQRCSPWSSSSAPPEYAPTSGLIRETVARGLYVYLMEKGVDTRPMRGEDSIITSRAAPDGHRDVSTTTPFL